MKLNLMELKQMHPLLPASTATEYGHRAAIGLERHEHSSGVAMATQIDQDSAEARLFWNSPPPGASALLDQHRVTEDAAEAISLALVSVAHGWKVRRRLQRGESADWLLRDADENAVALEVSGISAGSDALRLEEKLEQVSRATYAARRVACVVELRTPRTTLETAAP